MRSVVTSVLVGLALVTMQGCSGESNQPVPTEAGQQADLKAIQDSAAANDAAGKGVRSTGARKGYVPEP